MPETNPEELMMRLEQLEDRLEKREENLKPTESPNYLTKFQAVISSISITVGLLLLMSGLAINTSNDLSILKYQATISIDDRRAIHTEMTSIKDQETSFRDTQTEAFSAINARLARIEVLLSQQNMMRK